MTTTSLHGFESLVEASRRVGCQIELQRAPAAVPPTILGAPLDPELAALLTAHDGARLRSTPFSLFVRGVEQGRTIAHENEVLREIDLGQPYPIGELVVYAQVRVQSAYLACIPRLADAAGRQPVVYLDLNENPFAVPVGSGVDRAFALLAAYLDEAAGKGPDGLTDHLFPWHVPHLVRADAPLVALARTGAFDAWTGGDEEAREWIRQLVQAGGA